jgi:AcrR family transcriptional regulator
LVAIEKANMPAALRVRTRADPLVRREQILEHAIEIIGRSGYHGFTVQELAQRSGLTNGGLLYHFGSKESLLVALLEEWDRRNSANIAAAGPVGKIAGGHSSATAAILNVLRAIMASVASQPELARLYSVLHSEALEPSHPASAYFRAREAAALDGFAHLVGARARQPRSAARQIHALMDGLTLQWLRSGQAFNLVTEWDRAAASIVWLQAHDSPKRRRRRGKATP